jgi:hypothetical protein
MLIIGGLSNYTIKGTDTIRGDSLEEFPVAEGKIAQATETVVKKPSNAFEILWVDTKGRKRKGIIQAEEKIRTS